ncbi:MAG: type IV pilin-like G/H family protein [Synechococcales bacterium]|nr:type IV pilin-like G/H family protein [Synechococcales bacterium]
MLDSKFMETFNTEPPSNPNKTPVWIWALVGCLGCGGISIVLLGILMAIALPSFLNQANKAKESEAKTYTGSIMRGQQAFFLENNKFANTVKELKLGIQTDSSPAYTYKLTTENTNPKYSVFTAIPRTTSSSSPLHSYIGTVVAVGKGSETTTYTIICRSLQPSQAAPAMPQFEPKNPEPLTCASGSTPL